MATRIQVIVEEAEREAFRSVAEQEGLSLSAWLRQAGKDRLVATENVNEFRRGLKKAFGKTAKFAGFKASFRKAAAEPLDVAQLTILAVWQNGFLDLAKTHDDSR